MKLSDVRKLVKAVEPEASCKPTVSVSFFSSPEETVYAVRTRTKLDKVRSALAEAGYCEIVRAEVEGSRWDWTHVLHVAQRP